MLIDWNNKGKHTVPTTYSNTLLKNVIYALTQFLICIPCGYTFSFSNQSHFVPGYGQIHFVPELIRQTFTQIIRNINYKKFVKFARNIRIFEVIVIIKNVYDSIGFNQNPVSFGWN